MNVLFHSQTGDSLGLALRLQDEGHTVGFYIAIPRYDTVGRGLVYHVTDFIHATEDTDLIIFDNVGDGSLADLLREQGHAVVGASKFQDLIELDRAFGMRTFQAAGLRIPPTREFAEGDFAAAMAYVESTGGRYVFKPNGNIAADKTFVAPDAEAMVEYLEHLDKTIEREEGKQPAFMLQEFIEGVEVSLERWYANGVPVPGMTNVTFETKKFMAGDLGPAVGCMGSVVLACDDAKLIGMSTGKLDRLAREHRVCGPLDLNQIVAAKDRQSYILEATARFGYNALPACVDLWPRPLGPIFLALAHGEMPRVRLGAQVGAAIQVSVPPYPCDSAAKECMGTPYVDDVADLPNVWLWDAMLDGDGDLVLAGTTGIAYDVTGQGATVEAAIAKCEAWVKQAKLPDAQWRDDLGPRLAKRFAQLRQWGYLRASGRLAA